MIHNKLNLKIGELVCLDEKSNNNSVVKIVYISPFGLYSEIRSDGRDWIVMTNRLTKIVAK